jgi:hypothetical protein
MVLLLLLLMESKLGFLIGKEDADADAADVDVPLFL